MQTCGLEQMKWADRNESETDENLVVRKRNGRTAAGGTEFWTMFFLGLIDCAHIASSTLIYSIEIIFCDYLTNFATSFVLTTENTVKQILTLVPKNRY